jgi:transposase-like protein
MVLDQFEQCWYRKYPNIFYSLRNNWQNVSTIFNYLEDIRKAINTTNAIELFNSVIGKAINKRKRFLHDVAAKKGRYLAIEQAYKKWTMPIRNWQSALNRFMIEFEDRLANIS